MSATPSAKGKFKQPLIKQGKKKRKEWKIKLLGNDSSAKREASLKEDENSSKEYHAEWQCLL